MSDGSRIESTGTGKEREQVPTNAPANGTETTDRFPAHAQSAEEVPSRSVSLGMTEDIEMEWSLNPHRPLMQRPPPRKSDHRLLNRLLRRRPRRLLRRLMDRSFRRKQQSSHAAEGGAPHKAEESEPAPDEAGSPESQVPALTNRSRRLSLTSAWLNTGVRESLTADAAPYATDSSR
jgi:hypothetical protein